MNKFPNRRDFLKLAGLFSISTAGIPFISFVPPSRLDPTDKKNILIIVFDAFSAHHISLLGYSRQTTPNISRLAEKAIVYHNHYAGGNFTTPGTASLLTGTLPWTHRALGFFDKVSPWYADKSIFSHFNDYYRIAYTHNPLAAVLLNQFSPSLDQNIPIEQFLITNDSLIQTLFAKDVDTASVAWARFLKKEGDNVSYSLFLSMLYQHYQDQKIEILKKQFPHGLPNIRGDNYFTLEMVTQWLGDNIHKLPNPFMGYFHFIPPHEPYRAPVEFNNFFLHDKIRPTKKPDGIFNKGASLETMLKKEQQYDEYILYVDREFQKLFNKLEQTGISENTWIVLTSDHGELFERGIIGHVTPTLYEPVIKTPLVIFEPGRTKRLDITTQTSVVDILPTLFYISGKSFPIWTEGSVLPPFLPDKNLEERSIYAIQSKDTDPFSPLKQATVSLIKKDYKLMYFTGYPEIDRGEYIELYNLSDDFNELRNIYTSHSVIGKSMLDEVKFQLLDKNKLYS